MTDFRHALGAYLLGALEPSELATLETHLASCPECTQELASLAALPGLLNRLDAGSWDRTSEALPDPELLERILSELAHRRGRGRHRQRLIAVAAAATLIAVGGGGLSLLNQIGRSPSAAAVRTITASDASTGIHATARLQTQPWGTSITLRLGGVARGTHCQLVVVDHDGKHLVAGSWAANYEGSASITGAVDIQPKDLANLYIETLRGDKLLNLVV